METIPEGDWFCYECSNKNSIDKVCVICGRKGKLINCDTCTRGEFSVLLRKSNFSISRNGPTNGFSSQSSILTAWIRR